MVIGRAASRRLVPCDLRRTILKWPVGKIVDVSTARDINLVYYTCNTEIMMTSSSRDDTWTAKADILGE